MKNKGFTLIEILVTLAVVAILTAIAYPSYLDYIMSARRSDAKSSLMEVSQNMEKYYSQNNSYSGAALGAGGVYPTASHEGFYSLSIASADDTSFSIEATPSGAQTNDDCGIFSLSSTGQKGVSGGSLSSSECW